MPIPVDTDTDLEVIEHLDFDVPVLCEREGCGDRARWVMRLTCCGRSALLCEPHRLLCVSKWNAMSVLGVTRCRVCGKAAPHWRDLVEFIPIEAR